MRCIESRNRARLLLVWTAAIALGAFGLAVPAEAQVLYGSIVGNVSDSTNAAVPGATVTITHQETSLSREASTTAEGGYRFVNVLPGSYTVKVALAGFKEFIKQNVPVTVNTISRVDIGLEVGALTEAVTVQSERSLLQTDKADLHSELSSKEVTSLPLNNYRNYQSLLNLVPGATPARFQNAITDTPARALTTNVNGTNRMTNTTKLDGTTNTFIWLPHHSIYVAPSETVETVNVTTNSFDAEQGMAGGASVTVVTKSGTNDFRGTAFAIHDNEALRARNFFLPKNADGSPGAKPKTRRNIDGVTLGGPVLKNKLFFFLGWEGNHEEGARTRTGTVANEAFRRGDFSSVSTIIYDPATGNPDGTGRTPFPGNRIPQNRMDQAALQLQALTPLPTDPGRTTNNYTRSDTQHLDRNNYDFKLNFNRNSSHQVWAKYSQMNALVKCNFFLEDAGGVGLCDGGSGTGDVKVRIASLGHTWTLSPSLVLDGVFGLTRHDQDIRSPDFGTNFGSEVLGIPGTNGPDPRQSGMPIFNFGDTYNTLGNADNWSPIFRDERTYTFSSSLTWIRNRHDFKFGVDVVRMELNHWQPELGLGPRGGFRFLGGPTALPGGPAPNQFNNYAAFLLGLPTSMNKSLQYEEMTGREWQLAFYARDRWQVARNVTVSAGLRFERYPLMTRADRGIERYDPATNKVLLGGKGGNPEDLGIEETYPFVAPRLGVAWRVTDTSVIRAGYGLTISPIPFSRPLRGFYPLTINQDFVAANQFIPAGTLRTGIPEIVGPNLETGIVDLPATADMRSPGDKINRGYIQSWNLTYERKLPGDIAGAISYVGTQTTHQLVDRDINAAEPGTGTAGQPLFAAYRRTAATRMWDGWLSAHYHGLQVALNRPFNKGFFVKAAYTYSRAMNYNDDEGWATLTFNSPSAITKNYARAGYDQPHVFQFGFVADLPFGRDSHSFLGTLVKNWQVNGIMSAFSGRPFTPTGSAASLNAPSGAGNAQTPDQVGDIKVLGGKGPGEAFIDPTSFRAVTEVRFGNMGRNSLRGPSTQNIDLSLFRRFPVKGRVNLEARVEAFNLTNTPHFSGVNDFQPLVTSIASPAFLQLNRADADERQIRLGLRVEF